MLDLENVNVLYYSKEENANDLMQGLFFDIFYRGEKFALNCLDKISEIRPVFITEYTELYFAGNIDKKDEMYFGDSGAVACLRFPGQDEEYAVVMTNEEIYTLVKIYFEAFTKKYPGHAEKISIKLSEFEKNLIEKN